MIDWQHGVADQQRIAGHIEAVAREREHGLRAERANGLWLAPVQFIERDLHLFHLTQDAQRVDLRSSRVMIIIN